MSIEGFCTDCKAFGSAPCPRCAKELSVCSNGGLCGPVRLDERQPESGQEVLFTGGSCRSWRMGWYEDFNRPDVVGSFYWDATQMPVNDATYWVPLPEPPAT